MQRKERLKKVFVNKKTKKDQVKSIHNYEHGNYGTRDGLSRKKITGNWKIDAILADDLEEEFIENPDII